MFLVAQDFDVPPYDLPNLSEVVNTFPDFINEQEEWWLRKVLGNFFYDELVLGIEALPNAWVVGSFNIDDEATYNNQVWKSLVDDNILVPSVVNQWEELPLKTRWLLLRDGASYTYNIVKYKWYGMVKMLKPFIHSKWMEELAIKKAASGASVTNTENSQRVDSAQIICKGWNMAQELSCGKPDYMCWYIVYLYYDPYWYNQYLSMADSLYGYLYQNAKSFDDLDSGYGSFLTYLTTTFANPGRKNMFGI